MTIVALVGLPGSGKSTVSRQLARLLHGKQLDTDSVIEEFIGCTIAQFFEREGQEAFRELETQTLQEIVRFKQNLVLATGGGIVLRAINRELLHDNCFVVYLHAEAAQLYQRLKNDKSRPLLQNTDMQSKLQSLYDERHGHYAGIAHLQVESAGQTAQALAEQIAATIEARSA